MRYVAFLGGINVGGHRVKMDRLRDEFTSLGCQDVSTFIASGNVIFSSSRRAAGLELDVDARLHEELGYAVPTFVRRAADVGAISTREPWGAVPEGHTLMVWFLRDAPDAAPTTSTLGLSNDQDRFAVFGRELYQQIAGTFSGSSVKPATLARALGQRATARNTTSLRKLAATL
ncbi:MAG: DUF1697 domain-containing protein [Acidimicrobiia bacterium]